MKPRTKHLLIGIAIGIVIGIALFYLMMHFRVIRPFGFREFSGIARPENLSNFTRPFRPGLA